MSKRFELGYEPSCGAFRVASLEVVAAEFTVGLTGAEHVPVGDQDRVFVSRRSSSSSRRAR